jgi:glycosyltransferase involved in cell wall biosynthesis
LPKEVIIADDGSTKETQKMICDFQVASHLNLTHSWQKDNGFRVAKSRNKAIAKLNADYIILIDGDMILHPKFIEDHISHAESGYFVQGTRVLLTQSATQDALVKMKTNFSFLSSGIQNRKNAIHSNFLSRLFSKKLLT